MRVLFVSRQNPKRGITSVVKNQGESLIRNGIDIQYFGITGKGIRGYLKSLRKLREYLKNDQVDILHAHYGVTAILSTFVNFKPLIISLLGSEVIKPGLISYLIRKYFIRKWKYVIVKNKDMKNIIGGGREIHVIPNGVDFETFKPMPKEEAIKKTGFDPCKKNILFLSDPGRDEKNFTLAKSAVDILNNNDYCLHAVYKTARKDIPYYLNASELLILTSKWEGSPNAIKEAMACNLPIISTDVGDVSELFKGVDGCIITSDDPSIIAADIEKLIEKPQRTTGRSAIRHLDSKIISKKIIELYEKSVQNQ